MAGSFFIGSLKLMLKDAYVQCQLSPVIAIVLRHMAGTNIGNADIRSCKTAGFRLDAGVLAHSGVGPSHAIGAGHRGDQVVFAIG